MRAVVLALTVALVESQQINLVPEFARDNTYVYKYEALLLSGLPQKGLARAGIKLKSKVEIHAVTENNFLMKFRDPQLYEYAGIWPKDQFFPANKLTSALAAQLQIPIKFEYSNGVVGKVFAPSRVSPTVLNLYRGILNILQLNLKKTQNIYELQESGSQGVCKTHYVISEDPRSNHIIVTKSKDLSHCQERITKEVGLAYTEKCYECTKKVKSLIETASYNYIMKPAASGVLITEATVEEVHQFSPFNEIHGAVQMEANQTFSFVEIERKPIVPINADYLARGSLHYEFSNEILQNPIQLLKINNAPAQITEVLKHLVANNEAMVHDDAPLKFLELIQLLQHTTLQSIETIWAQFKHKPVYRRWLLDSLPAVGTHAVVKLIKEKFLADELTVPEFMQAFAGALQRVTADLDTIQLTSSLAMKEKITSNPAPRKVVMLGYGSLIAKYCVSHPNCPAELLRPIHEIIAEATSKNDIPEITLALKAMGNAGQPASLKPIMKLLPGLRTAATSLPIKVQVDAILAMQNIAKKDPKLVQPVALQILLDRALHPEVRMVACIVLFEAKPSVALVSNLAGALKMETNMHVASFVYSHIKSLTRNTSPDMASVAGAANVAIKLMSRKLDRLSFRFSRALQMEFYNTNLMIGATGSAYMINDATTILPRAFIAKARGYLAGNVADVLEIGMRTEGIQEVLKQSHAADESTERITKFKRTLRALANWKNLPNYHSWASAYVKVLGQEVAYLNINKTTIEEAVQNVTGHKPHGLLKYALKALQEGISFQYSKPLLASEVRRIVPTAVGFPMELSLYTTAVASGSLNVQATITPFPTEMESMTFEQLKKTDVQFQAEAKPSVALHTFATMGVNTALIQAAVMAKGKIRTIAPFKVSARADIFKGNYKVEALPVEVPEHIAAVSFETVAVVRNIEEPGAQRIVPLVPEFGMQNARTPADYWSSERADETPVRAAAPYHKTLCHTFRFIETKGCIEVQSHSASSISNATLFYIIGQHSARATVKTAEGPAVERFELEVQVGPRAAERLLKQIRLIDEESPEGKTFLLKLREILDTEDNYGSSSSESSSNRRPSSRSSSSSSSNSNYRSSSSSSSSSRRNDRSVSSSNSNRNNRSNSNSNSNRNRNNRNSRNDQNDRNGHNGHSNSSSSSSSMSSSHKTAYNRKPFRNFHKNQTKYLGNSVPPVFAVIARTVRDDHKMLGYQLAAFFDKQNARVQLIVSSIAENDNWKFCADGVKLSKHKVTTKVAWGPECQKYKVITKAETGIFGKFPAVRLELEYERLPVNAISYAKKLSKYIPMAAVQAGFSYEKSRNSQKEIELTVSFPTKRTMNIVARSPEMTLSRKIIPLPMSVPFNQDETFSTHNDQDISFNPQNYMHGYTTAQCSMMQDTISTFNNRKYKNRMPNTCYQVLAQDCTSEPKFDVVLKTNEQSEENRLNVKLAYTDVDLYCLGTNIKVKVKWNGSSHKQSSLSASLRLHPDQEEGCGLSLYAPSQGLQEVYFSHGHWKIQVTDWMKGRTCGLCGKDDGDNRQKYTTPSSGHVKCAFKEV
uniref:Vitellogenin n=1 Tax=Acheilognathus yamatsutae TaxID=80790 RepID=D8V115_9TELE|nr:vitellogenin [Acheilognathus yamatsutae]